VWEKEDKSRTTSNFIVEGIISTIKTINKITNSKEIKLASISIGINLWMVTKNNKRFKLKSFIIFSNHP